MSGASFDIVVIGAGHNSLTTAAYLATAGLSVVVVEARDRIGGGTITEELTLPGFKHDTFSTGHPFLLSNPMIARDELGLMANGLAYVGNDPVIVLPFPDGESITMWCDPERTAAEFTRFSKHDGDAWLAFLEEWKDLRREHFARLTNRPADIGRFVGSEFEPRYLAIRDKSGIESVLDMFESEHVRGAMLWFGMVMVQPIDQPGTGIMPLAVPAEWREGWINPIGGSVRLPEVLAEVVRANGGEVRTSAPVRRILVENERAAGVEIGDGTVLKARRAVVSSMHFTSLPNVLPATLPEAYTRRIETWRSGPALFVVHLAAEAGMRARTCDGSTASVLSGQSTVDGVRQTNADVAEGRLPMSEPWMFCACSTWIDPSRAPDGRAVIKVIAQVPYALDGDPANWAGAKDEYAAFLLEAYSKLVVGYRPGDELGRSVYSPVDIEATNWSLHRAAAQGGELLPDQMGENRPVKGWADNRTPVSGLYQTGSSAHPGGTVSGWPGRHAARAVMEDLQIDWRGVMTEGPVDERPAIPVIDTSEL